MPAPDPNILSLQENVLATAMLQRIGNAATSYELQEGTRVHSVDTVGVSPESTLVRQFAENPIGSLAWARESLTAIAHDERMSPEARTSRFDRYFDAYASLTVKLDHAAFPPTKPGELQSGVPAYVPDGFNDLGHEKILDASPEDRETLHVDKAAILNKYRPLLKDVFTRDYPGMSPARKEVAMAAILAQNVFFSLRSEQAKEPQLSGKVNLSSIEEGVCRHQALTFQVLAQAVGLKSHLAKGSYIEKIDGVNHHSPHAMNLLQIEKQWYILDVTNPDIAMEDDLPRWRLAMIPIDLPENRYTFGRHTGTLQSSGKPVAYELHNDMYWTID